MIKSKELRIGNYTQDQNGNLLKVWGLINDDITYHVVDRCKFPLPNGWSAERIPLTEEWLVKFGFENKGVENQYRDYDSFRYYKNNFNFEVIKGNEQEVSIAYWQCSELVYFSYGYVHKLQNLYFALTSEELTIKETRPPKHNDMPKSPRSGTTTKGL